MGPIGVQEMVLIFIVALVLFGPKKLPELGRTIGKAITEFRRASSDLKASFEREMHNLERETELKETTQAIASELPAYDSYNDFAEYIPEPYDRESAANSIESQGTAESGESAAEGVEGTVPRTESTPQHG